MYTCEEKKPTIFSGTYYTVVVNVLMTPLTSLISQVAFPSQEIGMLTIVRLPSELVVEGTR